MGLKGIDILSGGQFTREDLEDLFARADDFATRLEKGERLRLLHDKSLAPVFYEPSARTRLSFETAMYRLGGGVVSSAEKENLPGESLSDVIRACANRADAIVLRHPEIGAAQIAADVSPVPVLNAGDGTGEHPTQALAELYTIRAEKKTIDGLRVAIVGDLKNGITAHSLARALGQFKVDLSFVSPAALAMPIEICDFLRERDFVVEETNDLARTLQKADVVYMARVQKEHFADPKQYEKMKNFFVLNRALLDTRPHVLAMGAWDGAEEILADAYKKNSAGALLVRMALLAEVLA